jgi:DNA helicase II / ATP-dependent DNA helicase PcrA
MVTPTEAQQRIRDHEGLGLLVVAPAGCGKTEALAFRVAGLLERGHVAHPRRVLVTTFSNRARDNIRDRLKDYVPGVVMRGRVTVANFHGLSARLIRAHGQVIGIDPNLILPEADWVGEECQRRALDWNPRRAVEDLLRRTKQEAADDTAVEQALIADGNPDAIDIERQRISEGRLTYDDLPRLAELILANETIAELYRNHFSAVVVDEFQDLTPQQLRIVNRIGHGKTTFAGDLAQGIYGFAGAVPAEVDRQVRAECADVIEFAESHRSSPAVLTMVNALTGLTGGKELTSALPDSWPSGGLAAGIKFNSVADEANFAIKFAQTILERVPSQRIGMISRTANRRRFVDAAASSSGLPVHRWDDGVLDTDTARIIKALLTRLKPADLLGASDPVQFLRALADVDSIIEPDTRKNVVDALGWCLDRVREGLDAKQIRARIKVGDETTLLNAPGLHLLSGHVGKGQQFDWVVVIGAEDGVIPDFRATTPETKLEEARVLSVMISRARHGVVVACSAQVPTAKGWVRDQNHSPFFTELKAAGFTNLAGVDSFLDGIDWDAVAAR